MSADGRLLVVLGIGCRLDEKTGLPLLDEKKRPQDLHRSVHAYDPRSGTQLWDYTPPDAGFANSGIHLDPTATKLHVGYMLNGRGVDELRNARTGTILLGGSVFS